MSQLKLTPQVTRVGSSMLSHNNTILAINMRPPSGYGTLATYPVLDQNGIPGLKYRINLNYLLYVADPSIPKPEFWYLLVCPTLVRLLSPVFLSCDMGSRVLYSSLPLY